MLRNEVDRFEPTPEAEERWRQRVDEAVQASLLVSTPSWFGGPNVPGKPETFMPHSGQCAPLPEDLRSGRSKLLRRFHPSLPRIFARIVRLIRHSKT